MSSFPDEFDWRELPDGHVPVPVPDESDSPVCISLFPEQPIFNASPSINKEFENTVIAFDIKIGCDVHRISDEGFRSAVNAYMEAEAFARLRAAVREEISRDSGLEDVFARIVGTRSFIAIDPLAGVHDGQLCFELYGAAIPARIVASVIGTLWEGFLDNPIMTPMLGGTEAFPLLFCGGSFKFF
ncbi:MAG: hypothetical protein Q7R63_01885 [bacterium]|nr:hypothetical protein [bacterium]